MVQQSLFQSIPSVDQALKVLTEDKDLTNIPRTLLRELVNSFFDTCRQSIKQGKITDPDALSLPRLKPWLTSFVRERSRPNFRHVINATGVVIHTNLGRSLMAKPAIESIQQACAAYSNLEFSLETGKRGSRYDMVEDVLCQLTGAEAGLVVNNNAAAVLLMLDTLVKGKEVIVSRGELVEIGGSFRIPEVMAKSGAVLKEVGATNRTHLYDYEGAICQDTGALMKAHTSNYRIIGFHKEVSLRELVQLGQKYELPVLEDLGSGNLFDFPGYTKINEPTVQSVLKQGVSVVTFSGDKLLGGPQAGIILGQKELINLIKKNPLNRALRIDKMTLAGLEATLRLYKDPELAQDQIPTLNMICASSKTLKTKATRLTKRMKKELEAWFEIKTRADSSRVGGGASPELALPTHVVTLRSKTTLALETLRDFLLHTDPPLIGRVEEDLFCLDVRTIQPDELTTVIDVFTQAIHTAQEHGYLNSEQRSSHGDLSGT
jgi:L-seryl-tRNA(Ser) seleniumtransferase